LDFLACMGAFLGVIFSSVEYGLLIAVWIMTISYMLPTIEFWYSRRDFDCFFVNRL
jgi:uncharacterized membrane protein (DUF485 family)